ncbi:hypothetical protein F7725_019044 [Dissostichus mawsoni]|uniref:RING-type E3 ubiquitin transferase n=1 Tax=Dissostichus mawsoni TaxID=36200 RepID=A0A7J5XUW5_DISMA|nr:hypothetical protein F7725_019044 [Dissostichus mawsoni]
MPTIQRVDVVFDRYHDESIKTGTRRNVNSVTDQYALASFMALEENKADLARLLSNHLIEHSPEDEPCPVCSKFVSSDEMDLHLVLCLTKPRVTYNGRCSFLTLQIKAEDVLTKDAGECAICLEELQQGDTIARLPCLCIYHKG